MSSNYSRERGHFGLAFELAYFIHVNKEVAFFVAEDALDGLGSALGRQEKNRRPSELLQGFLKWGERSRPVSKTARLDERQMLQWLVYKQSEPWERETERGEGLYLPTEEDLIVRYVERLVFLTVRSGSFYVTLAVGSLLYQFNRRETRMFYDTLTQNDSARMKDAGYIGKQRLEVLGNVSRRFGRMVQTLKSPGGETQFLMRPPAPWVNDLVRECLRRFIPWGTDCVVSPGFAVTDIPGLYFSESDAGGEEPVEMNRIHTVLDPVCFARFTAGLSEYVRALPDEDRDKGCDYDSLGERLRVPRFSNPAGGTPRGDRSQTPELTREDYIRLERTLDARARRRKNFVPRQICVYVDDVLSHSFDPVATSRARHLIRGGAGIVEVRGRDDAGELTLATLFAGHDAVAGESLGGTVVHPGNKKVTVRLTPLPDGGGGEKSAWLEVGYRAGGLMPAVSRLARRLRLGQSPPGAWRGLGMKVGLAAALAAAAWGLLWWQARPRPAAPGVAPPEQAALPRVDEPRVDDAGPSPTPIPTPRKQPAASKGGGRVIARAAWSAKPEVALLAVPVETTRGELPVINTSRRESKVALSLPLYDDGGLSYSGYRLTLTAAGSRLWRQTLRAPRDSLTGYAHVLELSLFEGLLPGAGPYALEVEGRAGGVWRPVGRVKLGRQTR